MDGDSNASTMFSLIGSPAITGARIAIANIRSMMRAPHRPQGFPHNEGAYALKQPGNQPRLTVGHYLFSFLSCCHSLAPLAGIILVVPHPRVQHSVCEIHQ